MRPGVRRLKRVLGYLYATLFLLFLLLPLIVVIPASFSAPSLLLFPPKGFTFSWFVQLFSDPAWLGSFLLSLRVAGLAALVTIVCAVLLGLVQYRFASLGGLMWIMSMLPMFVPSIIIATGLFTILLNLGILGSPTALSLADAAASLPLAVALMVNAFGGLSPSLWFAAGSLGARSRTILGKVLLPEMVVPIISAIVLAFAAAFDETTFAIFIGIGNSQVLPARLYSYLTYQATPLLPAVASVLFTVALVCTLMVPLIGVVNRGVIAGQKRRLALGTAAATTHTQTGR
jgi:ABC-type spermidine/putrescine transport system permease subunit II